MKNKFKTLMAYLRGFKKDSIDFQLNVEQLHIDYVHFFNDFKITENFEKNFTNIAYEFIEKLYDRGPGSQEENEVSNFYSINGTIHPFENKIVFEDIDYTIYGTQSSNSYYDFKDYVEGDNIYNVFLEVRKFLENQNIEEMTVDYDGGGDSGSINKVYTTPGQTPNNIVSDDIENICYELLEDFGGWEIDEGSYGEIIFTKDEIIFHHDWRTADETNAYADLEITEDTFL
jgi:hypothetical protein